ncbi:lipid IV(A) 3-deoxy-D-manno-octulosonic acid transferase [Actinobacillus equuli subsp. haemolyticus]|uniref:lipid IV(A) 3-deoxy-D-manno-octulosonic acid transferase n=1 Tax=Actinobacillus equuli TaxID=718 RepID=UPI0024465FE1|nr:lipid IV(A) 3-deoxy-D-manno-octulosonic acid transferase [Actinobacillus equuli]WGE49846.1 lipid IV(A) 3-deoxy-D-manno-octulosonic acid transferase [Actinobacillus equuli subsp. haemolyticus]
MLRFFYTILSYIIQPLILLMMWNRGRKQPAYRRRLWERYGYYNNDKQPNENGIIVHAASVGEVIAATPLIKAIQAKYPTLPITVTTVTPTGSARVRSAFGSSVSHFYLPYDLPDAVTRFLDFIKPKLIIVIETELWPNLIYLAHKKNISFVIANARLSPRSAARYGWIKSGLTNMLNDIDLIMAQDAVSAERYLNLGFHSTNLVNTGNLKFDLEITNELRNKVELTKQELELNQRPVWIAGSTHEGEEKMLLDAHKQLLMRWPDLVLILVPRHPERFDSVEDLLIKSELNYAKRTDKLPLKASTQVLLGDTMGEMMTLYGLAQIAFVGGSLVKHGGHNPLEPIAFELPVISGVHTFNFPEIFSKLRYVKGVVEVKSNENDLAQAVNFLLEHPNACQAISQAGFSVLQENQGALKRHMQLLAPYLEK